MFLIVVVFEVIAFEILNSNKFVYYNQEITTNSKFQTQLSRKLQRFRACRKNKKCSIFHDFYEYQQKMANFFHWTGLLNAFTRPQQIAFFQFFSSTILKIFCIETLPFP